METLHEFLAESGFANEKRGELTPAAEDYLEMIYRISEENKRPVRICELSERLSVSPSSASRMAQSVSAWGYVEFRRYGYITLTPLGCRTGEYLIHRHRIVCEFLLRLTGEEKSAEAERIEHWLSPHTVLAMERMIINDSAG